MGEKWTISTRDKNDRISKDVYKWHYVLLMDIHEREMLIGAKSRTYKRKWYKMKNTYSLLKNELFMSLKQYIYNAGDFELYSHAYTCVDYLLQLTLFIFWAESVLNNFTCTSFLLKCDFINSQGNGYYIR